MLLYQASIYLNMNLDFDIPLIFWLFTIFETLVHSMRLGINPSSIFVAEVVGYIVKNKNEDSLFRW